MKRKFCALFCLFIIIIPLFSCTANDNISASRTYLIYMNGSDLESNYAAASEDIEEILKAKKGENTRIFIYTGGTEKWHTEGINSDSNEIFEVNGANLLKRESFPAQNMASASCLSSFIEWAANKSKTAEYNIILWNHGGNALTGFGKDENFAEDTMLLSEIEEAFDEGCKKAGIKFGFIAFDACLMASLEALSAVAEHCRYIVASEEVMPACGFDYKNYFNKERTRADASGNLALLLARSYFRTASKEGAGDYLSISVIDAQKLDALIQSVDKAVEKGTGGRQIMMFGAKSSEEGYSNMADILSLFEYKSERSVENLVDALGEAVIYVKNGEACKGACGISVYYPYYVTQANAYERYLNSTFSEKYAQEVFRLSSVKTNELAGNNTESKDEKLKLEIDGVIYECVPSGGGLFNEYFSSYAKTDEGEIKTYRIKRSRISYECRITAVFVSVDSKNGKSEQKYIGY